MATFILQNNTAPVLYNMRPVAEFCHENGHNIIDRSLVEGFDPDSLPEVNEPIIIYGSVDWMKAFLRSSRFSSHVAFSPGMFSISFWRNALGPAALNGDGRVWPAAYVPFNGPLHIRPESEDKAFAGGIYDDDSWKMIREQQPTTRCWASPPKHIKSEYRAFIVNGAIISASLYREKGENVRVLVDDTGLLAEMQELADIYHPASAFVMDVASTESSMKVIEYNSINCSGWYAADVGKVLEALICNPPAPKKIGLAYYPGSYRLGDRVPTVEFV